MANKITSGEEPQENFSEAEFSAILKPHRSLGKTGFRILMGFIAFSCLVSGALFWLAGAWPVMVTMVLDVLLVWAAFKINYRSGRQFEEIFVWPHQILFRKTAPSGKIQ